MLSSPAIDLGGTAINYTFVDRDGAVADRRPVRAPGAVEGRARHLPAADCRRPRHGGREGRRSASSDVVVVGLDTPGPASSAGRAERARVDQLRPPGWAGFDIREALAHKLGKPVTYLNDGNAGALWGHFTIFGASAPRPRSPPSSAPASAAASSSTATSSRAASGFGGELGHVLIPYQSIAGIDGLVPAVQLRPDGRSRVALLADGDWANAPAVLPDPLPEPRAGGDRPRCRLPSASAGWRSAATRCAATSSACRRTRSGCSSTR